MDTGIVSSAPLPRLVRWSARAASLLSFGLVMVIAFGQGGPPNPLRQHALCPTRISTQLRNLESFLS